MNDRVIGSSDSHAPPFTRYRAENVISDHHRERADAQRRLLVGVLDIALSWVWLAGGERLQRAAIAEVPAVLLAP